jgi:hypothetical protein
MFSPQMAAASLLALLLSASSLVHSAEVDGKPQLVAQPVADLRTAPPLESGAHKVALITLLLILARERGAGDQSKALR